RGERRRDLKQLLAEMSDEGLLSGNRKELRERGRLPAVAILDVIALDPEGDLVARPAKWDARDGPSPRIMLATNGNTGSNVSIGVGDRVLAELSLVDKQTEDDAVHDDGYHYEARPIRKLPRLSRFLLGIFRARGAGGVIDPIDRKQLKEWPVTPHNVGKAKDGDLVRFEPSRRGKYGVPDALVIEVLGNPDDQRQISLIAVHAHGIPDNFPQAVLDELDDLKPPALAGRTDLRELPLITIDPADARDHDDAVHAAPDPDPNNKGGHIVTVAIADVAHYVHAGSRLDREALKRGNSCYFPDRVVPMLPELISNDLCSLREGEDRPCLAVEMIFDAEGNRRRHSFARAIMRSAAKLSYQEAQDAIDGRPGEKAGPLLAPVLEPLWAAYRAVDKARQRRQPLDLDLPERKIIMNARGQVERVIVPARLEAHRLIEEFMIQANVCAAETLEVKRTALVYRIHDQPSKEKVKALRDVLDTLDMNLPKVATLRPEHFNKILLAARQTPAADLVSEVVLRTQAQAEYNTDNCGHFGLNLRRYAHFTSPIRRYGDLMIHRALIRALGLGADGLTRDEEAALQDIARAISDTERRAMAAERETTDRLIAAYLSDQIGATFPGRISGVVKSGLFVRLADSGADGFVPASTLGDEFYYFDERARALVGEYSARAYRLGDEVEVKLAEAIPMAGALRFEMLSEGKKGHVSLVRGHNRKRHRGGRGLSGSARSRRGRSSRRRR
ncbi:MAG TPA: ribonuclease R, partial [Rhodobacteraceae bacterium]|nr:ribonuclease R [Paracoccaceae bacterium]